MTAPSKPKPLPRLREDLQLRKGAPGADGRPTWLIFDPQAHRYFEISVETYQILAHWGRALNVDDLCALATASAGRPVGADDVEALLRFLEQSSLLLEMSGGWKAYADLAEKHKPGWLMWLVHNYLFVRIPLVQPHRFLAATLPLVEPLFSRTFRIIVLVLTVIGLYLTSRQWNEFISTFQHFFTLGGAALFLVTLVFVKALHELGHAYMATRFGCRVPAMGVALLVMMPMLYSDVTEAWKLTSRRQRMLIDAAGIIVELMIAGIATFVWAFLPDGSVRSVVFVLATTSWITSIAINLSPLMRFDGYFLFADWVGISNLQARANVLGRWKLREILFGFGEECPDRMPPATQAWVIGYAWMIWVYRLIVFTGIALTVYHMFFKLLGIVLFAVEIIWFIALPITAELKAWWARRSVAVTTRRGRTTMTAATIGALVLMIPWSTGIAVPAIIEPHDYVRIFPAGTARVKAVFVKSGQSVRAGDVLAELEAPKLVHQLRTTQTRIELVQARLSRRVSDKKDRSESQSLESELKALHEKQAGLKREVEQLVVRAPIDGVVADLNGELHAGRWIGKTEEIATIAGPGAPTLRGYLPEQEAWRVQPGAIGHFVFEDVLLGTQAVKLDRIGQAGSHTIDIPYLSSVYGGAIAVREDKERGAVPAESAYPVVLSPVDTTFEVTRVLRGTAYISGSSHSLLASFWRQTLKVLVRESGI